MAGVGSKLEFKNANKSKSKGKNPEFKSRQGQNQEENNAGTTALLIHNQLTNKEGAQRPHIQGKARH